MSNRAFRPTLGTLEPRRLCDSDAMSLYADTIDAPSDPPADDQTSAYADASDPDDPEPPDSVPGDPPPLPLPPPPVGPAGPGE